MAKIKKAVEAIKKLGKSKDSSKSNFEKAFADYDKQIKRKEKINKIKDAAGPVALTGAFGGTIGGNIYAAKNDYGLRNSDEKKTKKAKNKKKGMKAGGIVDRQYLKGR